MVENLPKTFVRFTYNIRRQQTLSKYGANVKGEPTHKVKLLVKAIARFDMFA